MLGGASGIVKQLKAVGFIILSIIFIVLGSLLVNASGSDSTACKSAYWGRIVGWALIVLSIITLFWNAWMLYKAYKFERRSTMVPEYNTY